MTHSRAQYCSMNLLTPRLTNQQQTRAPQSNLKQDDNKQLIYKRIETATPFPCSDHKLSRSHLQWDLIEDSQIAGRFRSRAIALICDMWISYSDKVAN